MARLRKNSIKNHKEVAKSVKITKNLGKGEKEVLKETEYNPDQDNRENPVNMLKKGQALIGLSKGCTLNMGNFQSAKIDVWVSRVCPDDNRSIMNDLADISVLLDEQLEYEQSKLNEEE